MTTFDLYKKHKQGEISREKFLYEVRKDPNLPWILNTTSYEDAVKILKNKGIVKEIQVKEALDPEQWKEEFRDAIEGLDLTKTTYRTVIKSLDHVDPYKQYGDQDPESAANEYVNDLIHSFRSSASSQDLHESYETNEKVNKIVDTLNPYFFEKAFEEALDKLDNVDVDTYMKTRAKVAKKMAKDPKAHKEALIANSKEVAKADEHLKEKSTKRGEQAKDEKNDMKKVKGQEIAKSNTKSSKKENKKGKPKGVKEMTYNAKKAKGISKVMEKTGSPKIVKESFLEALFLASKKKTNLNEDFHHEFGIGQQVHLPESDVKHFSVDTGVIKEINGGTLTIELNIHDEDNKPISIHRQLNVIKHANQQDWREDNVNEDKLEKHTNKYGQEFQVGDKVIDDQGKEAIIRGFQMDQGKVKALFNQGMHYVAVDIDGIEKPGEEKPESDEEYRKRVFGKLPNYSAGQGWLSQQTTQKESKLHKVINKLKEFAKKNKGNKKEMDEVDVIQGKDNQGNTVTLDTVPTGKGNTTVADLKRKGVRSATSKTVM